MCGLCVCVVCMCCVRACVVRVRSCACVCVCVAHTSDFIGHIKVPTPAVKVPTPQRAVPSDILSPVRLRHTPLETILAQSPNPSNSRSPLGGRRVTPIGKSKGSAFEVVTPRSPARSSNNLTNGSHVGKPKAAGTVSSEDDVGFPNAYTLTVKKRCCNAASVAYEIEVGRSSCNIINFMLLLCTLVCVSHVWLFEFMNECICIIRLDFSHNYKF